MDVLDAARSEHRAPSVEIQGRGLSRSETAVWRRRVILLITVLLAGRWLYAVCCPLDLISDEAYYWEWSRRLDWGYYSKPPMVAWIIRAATEMGGARAWVVRTPAVLLGTAGLWWMYMLAARMFDARVGFWSVALCAATPGSVALGLLMTIDAPFLFWWGASMYCVWRMLERRPGRPLWIVLTGICAGLGLLSKESMLAFLLATWLFLLLSRDDWCEWRRPGCIVMTGLALAMLTPVLVWNAHHNWVMFQHSATHFESQEAGVGTRLLRSGEFVGSQFGVISPVTCCVYLVAAVTMLHRWRRITRPGLFLMCFSAIPLAAVCVLSVTRRVEPNWPAPFYGAGLILVAAWLLGRVAPADARTSGAWFGPGRRLLASCVSCGVVCVAIAYLAPPVVLGLGWGGSRLDPTFRLRGWRELADHVEDHLTRMPRPEQTSVIVTTERQEASELAFYLTEQPYVFLWNPSTAVTSQYDLWPLPADQSNWDALIVALPGTDVDPQLVAKFDSVDELGQMRIPLGNGRCREYTVWLGSNAPATATAAMDQRDERR